MTARNTALIAILSLSLAAPAGADLIVPLTDSMGHDSGWDAIIDPGTTGLYVDIVTSTYVSIEVSKVFTEGPEDGEFPGISIVFHQRLGDPSTVPSIRINDETIVNLTGVDWTDYHWEIVGPSAAFNAAATDASGFSIAPFTQRFGGPPPPGWDAAHAATLDVAGGVVPDGNVFSPGLVSGRLVIDVNLGLTNSDFGLLQHPTPEPGTVGLLVIGGLLLLRRRRR